MKNTIELDLTKTMSIRMPSMPNFLIVTEFFGDNAMKEHNVSITDFTDEQLKIIGESWTTELIELARGKRIKEKQ